MLTWDTINIILCVLLLAFLCWKEWRRLNRSRLILRLAASLLAVVSLACLALPLTTKIKATNRKEKKAVLLTEGFDKDSVNSFLLKNSNIPVYALTNTIINAYKNYKIQFLSAADITSFNKQVTDIHIFGYGLDKEALKVLSSSSVVFHPAKAMDGITFVNWRHKIKAGDQLRVQGNFLNSSANEIKLILSGYGVNLDTAIIPAHKNQHFQLAAVPKQFGKAVFALTALAGKDTLERDPVPFETEQPGNLKMLLLSASPNFENKFLKSWLSQNNYALVVRTTISKNKYQKIFINTPGVDFNSITASFLYGFDLVIADAGELTAISKAELAAIETQVVQNGLGLIVKADSASVKNYFYSRPFPIIGHSDSNQKTLSVYIPVSNRYAIVSISERPAYIRPQPGTKSLIEDKQFNTLVGSAIYGSGKLIYTTLNNTFTWMLSGDNKTYQTFWSYLLENATAKTIADKSWTVTPAYPYADKAVEINYSDNNTATPQVQAGADFVHLVQDPDLPFQWQGSYWPQKSGWQPLLSENANTFWWYAYSANDWKAMSVSQKIKATLECNTADAPERLKAAGQDILVPVPVSKKYFFIIFLCCAGFLWIEKKL